MVPPAPSAPPVPSSSPTNHFPPSTPHLLRPASPPPSSSSFISFSSTTSSFFRHTLFRIIVHVHVFRSNTRVFHFTWTLIVHLCAHRRAGGGGGRQQTVDQKTSVQKGKRERKDTRTKPIADVARQGEKESKEENRGREKEEAGKEGADGRSMNMVDRPWMSGGAHGVTHAPHLAIRARASSLIK